MSHVVSAEIDANVLSVSVESGQRVDATDAVMMLDSMKMEFPVLAEVAGIVTEVVVAVGDAVHDGEPLVVIAEA
ncbi:MAG: biotin/lipoyl-containing protein [Propionibacteriaceae bacterium]|nr:biotin/lipoyl-containing protein [Propionibacteriaceae bacterium]